MISHKIFWWGNTLSYLLEGNNKKGEIGSGLLEMVNNGIGLKSRLNVVAYFQHPLHPPKEKLWLNPQPIRITLVVLLSRKDYVEFGKGNQNTIPIMIWSGFWMTPSKNESDKKEMEDIWGYVYLPKSSRRGGTCSKMRCCLLIFRKFNHDLQIYLSYVFTFQFWGYISVVFFFSF